MNLPELAVTNYCERIDDTFWSEPLNAITNLAFVLVAFFLGRRLLRHQIPFKTVFDLWLLIFLIGAIGIGSFLWHTLATPLAQWLDVVPILLYMSIFLLAFMPRHTGLSISSSIAWLLLFYFINTATYLLIPADTINGSIYYLPSMVALLFLSMLRHQLYKPAILFIIGITFRSTDQLICPWFAIGSHFLWHFCISLVVLFTTTDLLEVAAYQHRFKKR